ncbi:TonB-dependent receptor [Chromobacterium sp. CV08]|uniref:TonB-dependent receptor n=1 Tax=Chromobacterium sp. CV08 TaxID=3133274 RepID=UPI003DAA2915
MKKYALAALPLAMLAAYAQAEDPAALDRVIVTAPSAQPTRISELPGTAWVVGAEEIQQQAKAGVPLKEALGKLVPGLDIGSEGRSNNDQNLRGRSMLVMIDGVSLNSTRSLSRQFDSIDPFNIERIEVLSGASALYGGGAGGGIINIITKHGESGPARFTTEIGARSGFMGKDDLDRRIAQSVSGGNDIVAGRLGLAYQQNGAAYGGDGKQIFTDITQTDLQYNRSIDLMGNLDFKLPGSQKLSLTAQYYDSGYDGDYGLYMGKNLSGSVAASKKQPANPNLLQMRDGFDSDRTPKTKRWMAQFNYFAPDVLGGHNLYIQGSARQEQMDFFPFPGSTPGPAAGSTTSAQTGLTKAIPYYGASQQNTNQQGLKAVLTKDWTKRLSFSYGIEASRDHFDANQMLFNYGTALQSGAMQLDSIGQVGRYPNVDTTSLAAFAQGKWQLDDKLSLNFGLRKQRISTKVDDFVPFYEQVLIQSGKLKSADAVPGGSKSYSVLLPNIGAVYKLMPGSQLWANYSEGFDLPDGAKWYGQGNYTASGQLVQGVSVANSALDGIKTRQIELGWRFNRNNWEIQAAPFYAWSDKALGYDKTTLLIQELSQKVRTYGLEGQVAYNFSEHWRLGGNLLAIKSEQQNANGGWGKQAVTSASPSKTGLFIDWNRGNATLRLQGQKIFDLDDASGNKLNGYATADLLGSYKLPVGTLSFGVQNLFNKTYQTLWSQRATIYYGGSAPGSVTPQTVYYQGRGRTYGLSYSVSY